MSINKTAAPASVATVPAAGQKFEVPPAWRERCEIIRLNNQNRTDFVPLYSDFLKVFLTVPSVNFTVFFAVGWEMFEFMRPKDFSPELVKEMLITHKQFPTTTRICVRRDDHTRYEQIVAKMLRQKFETAAPGGTVAYESAFKLYSNLALASQSIIRGSIDQECYKRVARASSQTVTLMCSNRDTIRFLVEVVGRDPGLYEHGAVSAMVSAMLGWNILKLSKREAKLTVQSALLHDIERHCAYMGKPADPTQISNLAIKEVTQLVNDKIGFHEINITVMQQHRELFQGGGHPRSLKGAVEKDPMQGIHRLARIVSIGCGFSEYLLKRKDKLPLTMETISQLLREKTTRGAYDPDMVERFLSESNSPELRRAAVAEGKDDAVDDETEAYGDEDFDDIDLG